MSELEAKYPEVFEGDCEFLTSGHPYVWVDSSISDLQKLVEAAVTGVRGMPRDPPFYSCKWDSDKRRFYFVPCTNNFDFDSLVHYEDYVPKEKRYTVKVR